MTTSSFQPGWPIDERKYLKLLRKHAKVKDYTIAFRGMAAGMWTLLGLMGVTQKELGMENGGTREAQYERMAVLIDSRPEEMAVLCVYMGEKDYSDIHGHTFHPAPKVLESAHQVALKVLDTRSRLIREAAIEPASVVTEFNIADIL